MLKKHPSAVPFINLVNIPEYIEHVTDPIDLTILEQKLKAGNYKTSGQFINDCRKIWKDTLSVSHPGNDLYNGTTEMKNYFESLVGNLGDVPLASTPAPSTSHNRKAASGSKSGSSKAHKKGPVERPMSGQEKALLKQNIMRLSQDKLQGVIQIYAPYG